MEPPGEPTRRNYVGLKLCEKSGTEVKFQREKTGVKPHSYRGACLWAVHTHAGGVTMLFSFSGCVTQSDQTVQAYSVNI